MPFLFRNAASSRCARPTIDYARKRVRLAHFFASRHSRVQQVVLPGSLLKDFGRRAPGAPFMAIAGPLFQIGARVPQKTRAGQRRSALRSELIDLAAS
jgi:hypothetical protein